MLITAVLVVLLYPTPGAADTYTLRWQLKEGDVFYTKSNVTSDQTIEVMGQKIEKTIKMDMVIKFAVKSAKPGATVVEMTYLHMKVDAGDLPGENIRERLKGVAFTATLDNKMQVTKLEGYDKLLDAVGGDDEMLKKRVKAMLPKQTIHQAFGQTFMITPNKPIAVGATWGQSSQYSLGFLGSVDSKRSFKLDSVKKDIATISVKGQLAFKPAESADNGVPFRITKADLKPDGYDAACAFDMKLGRIIESTVRLDLSGTMTIRDSGMEVDAKLKQKMTMTSTLSEKNPIKH